MPSKRERVAQEANDNLLVSQSNSTQHLSALRFSPWKKAFNFVKSSLTPSPQKKRRKLDNLATPFGSSVNPNKDFSQSNCHNVPSLPMNHKVWPPSEMSETDLAIRDPIHAQQQSDPSASNSTSKSPPNHECHVFNREQSDQMIAMVDADMVDAQKGSSIEVDLDIMRKLASKRVDAEMASIHTADDQDEAVDSAQANITKGKTKASQDEIAAAHHSDEERQGPDDDEIDQIEALAQAKVGEELGDISWRDRQTNGDPSSVHVEEPTLGHAETIPDSIQASSIISSSPQSTSREASTELTQQQVESFSHINSPTVTLSQGSIEQKPDLQENDVEMVPPTAQNFLPSQDQQMNFVKECSNPTADPLQENQKQEKKEEEEDQEQEQPTVQATQQSKDQNAGERKETKADEEEDDVQEKEAEGVNADEGREEEQEEDDMILIRNGIVHSFQEDQRPTLTKPLPSGAQVVNLTSGSDEDQDENDNVVQGNNKENEAIALQHGRAEEETVSTTAARSVRDRRSRHSFIGPLAMDTMRKTRERERMASIAARSTSFSNTNLHDHSIDRFDVSQRPATEEIQEIGINIQRLRLGSQTPASSHRENPSLIPTLSSRMSICGSSVSSKGSRRREKSNFAKRSHIYLREHKLAVSHHNTNSLKRTILQALSKVNATRQARRMPVLSVEQLEGLAIKGAAVRRIIDSETPRKKTNGVTAPAVQMGTEEDYTKRFLDTLLKRETDAQSLLPLPTARLNELERLKREEKARLKKLRGVLGRPPLPDKLPGDAEREVDLIFCKPGNVSSIPGAQVDDKDIRKLLPRQWLNDEVINFYGNLILLRSNEAEKARDEAVKKAEQKKKEGDGSEMVQLNVKNGKRGLSRPYDASLDAFWRVHYFSSFFWENLKNRGFDGVKRWTRKVDIFTKDLVLFPINLGNSHWVCGAINFRLKRFEYYDSMGTKNHRTFKLMRDYLSSEAMDKKKKRIDLHKWQNHFSRFTPQQENGYDCGVFACVTLEQISRRDPIRRIPPPVSIDWKSVGDESDEDDSESENGWQPATNHGADEESDYDWNFSQKNMPYLRRRMAYEISAKKLLD